MRFSLQALMIHSCLLATAFALVYLYGETAHAHVTVSAIYALAFSFSLRLQPCFLNGGVGAITGWAIALLTNVGIELFEFLAYDGAQPYFDGEGPVFGLVYLPLLAFFYLLVPLSLMGCVIGYVACLMRSDTPARATHTLKNDSHNRRGCRDF